MTTDRTSAGDARVAPANGATEVARLVRVLAERGLTLAVAESLTGGALASEIVSVPGASVVFRGGVVAYATPVKASLLGVDAELLEREGAVHAEVAAQMARGARTACAVEGVPADLGLATTGVAGPDPQDGRPPGTVFVGVSIGGTEQVAELALDGSRAGIRAQTVRIAIATLLDALESDAPVAEVRSAE